MWFDYEPSHIFNPRTQAGWCQTSHFTIQALPSDSQEGCIQLLTSIWPVGLFLLLFCTYSFAYSSLMISSQTSGCKVVREKGKNDQHINRRAFNYAGCLNKQSTLLSLAMSSVVHTSDLCSVVQPFLPRLSILLFL